MSAPRNPNRFHGRLRGSSQDCAHNGCTQAGEFRAPITGGKSASPNGPGDYQLLCLDHVREFNARYDYYEGMSAEEIAEAQSPMNFWPSETRAFRATADVDIPPKWSDFNDPLDAISTRFKSEIKARVPSQSANGHFWSADEHKALKTLGLEYDVNPKSLRTRYSNLVRKYHPDKNGGDRSFEKKLHSVVAAYQLLRVSPAFVK
jgi:hypothetical protein